MCGLTTGQLIADIINTARVGPLLVAGKKCLKTFAFDLREQRAIFDAAPLHADDGVNVMLREMRDEFARYVLIEKDLRCCACN